MTRRGGVAHVACRRVRLPRFQSVGAGVAKSSSAQVVLMDTEEWWTTYHKQHGDFREWVLDGSEVVEGAHHILTSVARSSPAGKGRVLHIGCGSSTLHLDLLKMGFHTVVNIDFSKEVIDRMLQRFGSLPNVEFVVADARELDPATFGGAESFDCIVGKGLFDCLLSHGSEPHKISNTLQALRSIRALMKPGALIVETSMFEPAKRVSYLQTENIFEVQTLAIGLNPLELPHQKNSFIYILRPRQQEDNGSTSTGGADLLDQPPSLSSSFDDATSATSPDVDCNPKHQSPAHEITQVKASSSLSPP